VVKEEVQKHLPSPNPPPPPFAEDTFGLDMWHAATSFDTKMGSKALTGGAGYTMDLTQGAIGSAMGDGYKTLDSAVGVYKVRDGPTLAIAYSLEPH